MRIGVLGAGISGLACARILVERGLDVSIFEKSRGLGGRAATRRDGDFAFDHGAQYFTVRDPRFAKVVAHWRASGVVEAWTGRIVAIGRGTARDTNPQERLVGVPGMSAIGRHLADGLDVRHACRIAGLEGEAGAWRLVADSGSAEGPFDFVVVALPAAQAAPFLSNSPALSARAASCRIQPCWAVIATYDHPLGLAFDGAFISGTPLAWAARNTSKPGRQGPECWVLHATPEWSAGNLEAPSETVQARLLEAFGWVSGANPPPARALAHRWRYALPQEPLAESCLLDPRARLGACGDWCGGPRIEGAYLSGLALGEAVADLEQT